MSQQIFLLMNHILIYTKLILQHLCTELFHNDFSSLLKANTSSHPGELGAFASRSDENSLLVNKLWFLFMYANSHIAEHPTIYKVSIRQ